MRNIPAEERATGATSTRLRCTPSESSSERLKLLERLASGALSLLSKLQEINAAHLPEKSENNSNTSVTSDLAASTP